MKELAAANTELCVGEYNGHMAAVPHNPTIKALFDAMGNRSFSSKLRDIADALDADKAF
jgi:hypothetical protein